MLKGLCQYLLVLFFLFGLWNLLLGYFPFLMVLFFILLFFINIILSYKGMKKAQVQVHITQTIVERQEQFQILFKRKQDTLFSTGKIVIEYRIFNAFSQCVLHKKVILEDQEYLENVSMKHTGYYYLKIDKIYCYDILQCLYFSHICSQELHFYVFPSLIPVMDIIHETAGKHHESFEYSPYVKGDDYSEMFDLRSYRENDSLRYIHWKASLKKDELLVKEGSQPIVKKLLLSVEIHQLSDFDDHALDQFYSLCSLLSQQQIAYEIICPHAQSEGLGSELISNDYHFRECMKRILKSPIEDIQNSLIDTKDISSVYIVKGDGIEVYER